MPNRPGILFVVENDYYPRDMRVYNESVAVSSFARCYVLAPRGKGQPLVETVKSVQCIRFPHFEAHSLRFIPFEYLGAALSLAFLIPLVVLVREIKVVHVANPPDFILPLVAWLKLFGTNFVFDVHDLSVETFRGKSRSPSLVSRLLLTLLGAFERMSVHIANVVVATNGSVSDRIATLCAQKPVYVVRNSNEVVFRSVDEVHKPERGVAINIGFFGMLGNDEAAGLDNFFALAEEMEERSQPYSFSIVGDGPGLPTLRKMASERGILDRFRFYGFVPMPGALSIIKGFDFGLVTWGDLPKNHVHTAMKIMDYMCCAVPVCSLNLKEQLVSTASIGIHGETFIEIAEKMVDVYRDSSVYERLRQSTLDHFNNVLSWKTQERELMRMYSELHLATDLI